MNILFRTDASLQIGTGHVMRCLTLADELARRGHQCLFICRDHPGHLGELIASKGFELHLLANSERAEASVAAGTDNLYDQWLGVPWQQDARQTLELLVPLAVDWLVVDHYALDARWEAAVLPEWTRLLVIDDLADRAHVADLLLDQNLGRKAEDYAGWVPEHCRCLIGPSYALLRPEFARLREASLARRSRRPRLRELLITMGGVDKDNATADVLSALAECPLPQACRITVVMGALAPWLEAVKAKAAMMPCPTEVVVNVPDMAERMASADLAIGAAGSTSWERCCLGLPALMVVLAENQRPIAEALDSAGAAIAIGPPEQLHGLAERLATLNSASALQAMSVAASQLTAGKGVMMICDAMRQEEKLA